MKAPDQDQLKIQSSSLEGELILLHQLKSSGMITDDQEKLLKEKQQQLFQLKNDLKKKESNIDRQKKSRDNKKKVIGELIDQDPSIATKLKIRKEPHIPRI